MCTARLQLCVRITDFCTFPLQKLFTACNHRLNARRLCLGNPCVTRMCRAQIGFHQPIHQCVAEGFRRVIGQGNPFARNDAHSLRLHSNTINGKREIIAYLLCSAADGGYTVIQHRRRAEKRSRLELQILRGVVIVKGFFKSVMARITDTE